MIFEYTDKTKGLIERVRAFMDEHVYPNRSALRKGSRRGRALEGAAGHRGTEAAS